MNFSQTSQFEFQNFKIKTPWILPMLDRQDNPDGRSNVRSLEATWGLLDPTARFGKFSKSNSTNPTLKRSKINGRLTGRLSSPATPNRFAWSYAQGTLNSTKDSFHKKYSNRFGRSGILSASVAGSWIEPKRTVHWMVEDEDGGRWKSLWGGHFCQELSACCHRINSFV